MSLRSSVVTAGLVLLVVGCVTFFLSIGSQSRNPSAAQVRPLNTVPFPISSVSSGKHADASTNPSVSELALPVTSRTTTPTEVSTPARVELLISRWLEIGQYGEISGVRKASTEELLFPFVSHAVSEDSLVFFECAIPHLVFADGNAQTNHRLKQVSCIIDQDTGQLVQAMITDPTAGALPGEMQRDEAEVRYKWANEEYLGLPETPPSVDLGDILQCLPDVSMADVRNCRRITASYLVSAENGVRDPMPVWVVHCQGFPAYPSRSPDRGRTEPSSERTFLRLLFDKDGTFLQADNQPLIAGPWTKGVAQ